MSGCANYSASISRGWGMNRFFLVLLTIISACGANALTTGAKRLIEFETQGNAVSKRSNQPVKLPHIEIPLDMVAQDFASRLDPAIANSLVITKQDGKKYVRWILNPEDTKWGKIVIQYFAEQGLKLDVQYYFTGYQTASRSYIAEDPASGVQFSVKSSTNNTGGSWRDKKQPVGEAVDARVIGDFLYEQNKKRSFKNFLFMDEPAVLKIDKLDQAIVIRDLGELKTESKRYYLPGFSALHETVGASIAKINGSNDPYEFWTENYIKVAGRALGELAARTGMQFDSPHSQNFLVELDEKYKPTGRLVLRDLSDLYVDKNFFKAIYGSDNTVLNQLTQKGNILDHIAAGFGPLHGNKKPSWVSESRYQKWKDVFFQEFESAFQNISGFDLSPIKNYKSQNGDYFGAEYGLAKEPTFNSFFDKTNRIGYVRAPVIFCEQAFAQ
jgi:hypothetical protein